MACRMCRDCFSKVPYRRAHPCYECNSLWLQSHYYGLAELKGGVSFLEAALYHTFFVCSYDRRFKFFWEFGLRVVSFHWQDLWSYTGNTNNHGKEVIAILKTRLQEFRGEEGYWDGAFTNPHLCTL